MDHIEAVLTMPSPSEAVSTLFWDICRWQQVWQPIEQVEVTYDDGWHQEFVMAVWRDNQREQVRTIRFRDQTANIHFFSPNAPPMMDVHHGTWRFEIVETGCRVTATRDYVLTRLPEEQDNVWIKRRMLFRSAFAQRLAAILARFHMHFDQAGHRSQ